jgi:hypothetical protein
MYDYKKSINQDDIQDTNENEWQYATRK